MRPLELHLRAFGPFADETRIDFSLLGARSLFLISGPTGSGKSSVLDGICYALYGETSAREREETDIRSHHAGADSATEVAFTFAQGADRYRIIRAPKQERPKKTGPGTTSEPKRAEMYRWDDERNDWILQANRPADVDARVVGLLGFQAAQFRQVVILPQGKIRRLLSASSEERREILATLFQTHTYRRIQEALRQEAKTLSDDMDALARDRAVLLENEAVGDPAALAQIRADLGQALARIDASLAALAERERDQRSARDAGRDVMARLAERDAARAAARGLAERASERAGRQLQLERARRAQALVPQHRALADLRSGLTATQAALLRLRDEAAQAGATLAAAEAAWHREQERRDEREAALRAQQRLDDLAADAEALEAARSAEATAAEALEQAATEADGLAQEVDRLRRAQAEQQQALLQDRAGHLAASLAPGQPCPVCGSREHPAPAPRGAGPLVDEAALDALSAKLPAIVAAAETRAAQRRELEHSLAEARARKETLAERVPEPYRQTGALAEARRVAAQTRRALEQGFETAQAARAAAAEAQAAGAARAEEKAQQVAQQEAALAEQTRSWAGSLQAASFDDEAAFEAARLDEQALAALARQCQREDAEHAAAGERLARAEAALADAQAVDLDALERALAACQVELAAANEERGQTAARVRALDEKLATLQRKAAQQAELEARHALVGDLAAVACDRATSFETWVLSAMLDEVLTVASQRLWSMSQQRYLLRRDCASTDRRRHSGLELVVFDAHTGTERPVRSLSGGEGFLASLALALALAEVVQSQAGGIHLDTIFIDEGFGSLDPESLEQAFATLMQIEQSGRLVGIISHVGELAERIDARLQIQPSPRGSSARFVI